MRMGTVKGEAQAAPRSFNYFKHLVQRRKEMGELWLIPIPFTILPARRAVHRVSFRLSARGGP